ncbi:MAG: YlxM family DNA-binding protein [Lachnospira pectinoschiza]
MRHACCYDIILKVSNFLKVVLLWKVCRTGTLYDFYGELLNEHQRGIYQDIVFNYLSLSEVADEYGISRQGVHDLIKRVNNTLNGYEEKLHLVSKFIETKEKVHEIEQLSDEFIKSNNGSLDNIRSIQLIAKDILDNF